ncbi:MAG: EAL domain-containing protein [Oscillospiraceae bacterium]|nr:EAL domain-containing protein [Oscillospiraceae bacterium]
MKELLERKQGFHRTILIADDEFIEREMLGAMLCDEYDLIYAEDGSTALDMIQERAGMIALVLLDLHMPKLDGYAVLKAIRSDSEMRRIPVIVLTAETEAEVRSLHLGAADFISKPYNMPDVVKARVGHAIELAENSVIIHETERDSLTSLFKRDFFFEYGKMLDIQNRHMPMDAIVLDINRFRIVNELYGKQFGDLILKRLGNSLHELVRYTGGLACRSGSNTFYLYLPHSNDISGDLVRYTTKINEYLDDRKITVRIGVYSDDGSPIDMEHRFDRAELACRKLRGNYSTEYVLYNAELHSRELHSERLINDIDKALSEKQFKVYYQPKYNITGEKPLLVSAEALVRWVHPEFGMIPPGEFISLFENNGLIQLLDRYVWSEAAAQIRKWSDKYGVTLPVSVNVSRVDIFDPQLSEILSSIASACGLSPHTLLLEITESAYTDDSQQIIDTVSALRSKGFRIEMDDFGCGYSSLNMLTELPLDALKLDMNFIKNIEKDHKAYRLVGIMIEIARMLEVPVIAEGVETKGQMELLHKIGCDIIQGYYFSKPLPPDEFEKLFEKTD